MRVTVIPSDGFVIVDGVAFTDLDLSAYDQSIQAIQWWGEAGEIERRNPVTLRMVANEPITSPEVLEPALAVWQQAKVAYEIAKAEEEAAIAAMIAAANEAAANQQTATEPKP